jgi:hypothetical protein
MPGYESSTRAYESTFMSAMTIFLKVMIGDSQRRVADS